MPTQRRTSTCVCTVQCRLNERLLLLCPRQAHDVLGEQAVRRLHDEGAHLVAMERAWLPLHLMMRARGRKANR